jgi:hypothetical protein
MTDMEEALDALRRQADPALADRVRQEVDRMSRGQLRLLVEAHLLRDLSADEAEEAWPIPIPRPGDFVVVYHARQDGEGHAVVPAGVRDVLNDLAQDGAKSIVVTRPGGERVSELADNTAASEAPDA